MWPDLWFAFAALTAALLAIPLWRWLARAALRLVQQGQVPKTVRSTPVSLADERAVPVAAPILSAPLDEHRPTPIAKRNRRLTRRKARDGVVLATILGPCRGQRMQEHDL